MPSRPPRPGAFRIGVFLAVVAVMTTVTVVVLTLSGGEDAPAQSSGTASSAAATSPQPTVLPPLGLVATPEAFSVRIQWSPPAGGTEVARYAIYRSDDFLAAVDPPETTYIDETVTPGQEYTYEVEAQGSGAISDRATVSTKTPVPALRDARLKGLFDIKLKVVSQQGYKRRLDPFTLGFQLDPTCEEGACRVEWRVLNFKEIKTTLERNGGTYSGSDAGRFLARCGSTVTRSTLTIVLEVTRAEALSGEWRALEIKGTLESAEAPQLGCVSSGVTYSLTGSLA